MIKILYVKIGATSVLNRHYETVLNRFARPGVRVEVVNVGAEGEESTPLLPPQPLYIGPVCCVAERAAQEGYRAVIIGCTADPALDYVKRIAAVPVTAPLEASLHIASMIGSPVVIFLPGGPAEKNLYADRARRYGLHHVIGQIVPVDVHYPPPDDIARWMRTDPDLARERILVCHQRSVHEQLIPLAVKAVAAGAGSIFCGCTLWMGMLDPLRRAVSVPVLDPGEVAVRVAETLAIAAMPHDGVRN